MRSIRSVVLACGLGMAWSAPAMVLDPDWVEEATWAVDPLGAQNTALAWAPDGSDRLFVLKKNGVVRVLSGALANDGGGTWTTFATETVHTNGESGLLGIAFDPDFPKTQWVYFFVTTSPSGQRIVRYDASAPEGSRTVVGPSLPTTGQNHNGGALGFGHDGRLYWAIGDLGNGSGVNADLTSLAAKVGRANPDGTPADDNPFNDGVGPNDEYIWARGFRNPFKLAFQPTTGSLWLNVAGSAYEQVFVAGRGQHGGYAAYENNQPSPDYILPRIAYRTNGTDTRGLVAVSRHEGIATYAATAAHGFRPGASIEVSGTVDPEFSSGGGRFDVLDTPTATSFTVAQPGLPDVASMASGGQAETLYQGGSLTGGAFYDATLAPPSYRGNYFYGDYNSGQLMRALVDPGSTAVRGIRVFAEGSPTQVDMAVGPDGNLYYTGHSTSAIRRARFNATQAGIAVDRQHLRVEEAGVVVVNVRLATAPPHPVSVRATYSGGDTAVQVVGPQTLVFGPQDWWRPQPLRLHAAGDADPVDGHAAITLSADGMDDVVLQLGVRDRGAILAPVFGDGFEAP